MKERGERRNYRRKQRKEGRTEYKKQGGREQGNKPRSEKDDKKVRNITEGWIVTDQ